MNFFNNDNQGHYVSMAEGFMSKVYGWMCIGLSMTAAVAYYFSPAVNPHAFATIMTGRFPISFVLMAVQIGIVLYFSWSWRKLSYSSMAALFVIYSALNGVTLSPILYVFTGASVFYVFLIAAGMFATMALYGTVTKTDLSSMRNILFMGLIGLIIANFINLFIPSAALNIFTSAIGVGIFSLLTAYDVQKLRRLSQQMVASHEDVAKVSLLGALHLYLDIINLFLYLLRLFGQQRRN